MKKIITYISLCLIATILLPGCRSKMGMMKRHYSKGYYVSHSKSKSKTLPTKEEPKQVITDKVATVIVLKAHTSSKNERPMPTRLENITANAAPSKKGNIDPETKITFKDLAVNKSAKEVRKTISQLGSASRDGEGLSLFWLVILVILILWLFGFLAGGFGLGGLINLLLVIALILLILWLLRVV